MLFQECVAACNLRIVRCAIVNSICLAWHLGRRELFQELSLTVSRVFAHPTLRLAAFDTPLEFVGPDTGPPTFGCRFGGLAIACRYRRQSRRFARGNGLSFDVVSHRRPLEDVGMSASPIPRDALSPSSTLRRCCSSIGCESTSPEVSSDDRRIGR